MRKTSVYLTNEEAESLRRLSALTGKPQAEIIRAGIRLVVDQHDAAPRQFRSLGAGHGDGTAYTPWSADDLYQKVMAQ